MLAVPSDQNDSYKMSNSYQVRTLIQLDTSEGGRQIFCSSERRVQNFCHVILNSTTPTAEL